MSKANRRCRCPGDRAGSRWGSYVLQKVRCGKSTCFCARAERGAAQAYWYLYWKKDGKTKSRYVVKERPAEG